MRGMGNMGNMQKMMKQMKKVQKEMETSQRQLDEKEFVGIANNDLVKVTFTGNKTLKRVDISEEIVDPEDKEIIEDLVLIAVNDALEKIDEETEKVMGKYQDNLNIPGF